MYYKNLNNFIIDNVLTNIEKEYIYSKIKESSDLNNTKVVSPLGHITYFFHVSDDFKNSLLNKIQQYFEDELIITELSAAIYSNKSGYVPKLPPHYDVFLESRVTFDIQLNSTIKWPIVIENNEFLLKDNQGLIFSGTDQIHWRTQKTFSDDDHITMLFVHLSKKNNNIKISKNENDEREKRYNYYYDLCKIDKNAIEIGK
jgi:hypothetical protein